MAGQAGQRQVRGSVSGWLTGAGTRKQRHRRGSGCLAAHPMMWLHITSEDLHSPGPSSHPPCPGAGRCRCQGARQEGSGGVGHRRVTTERLLRASQSGQSCAPSRCCAPRSHLRSSCRRPSTWAYSAWISALLPTCRGRQGRRAWRAAGELGCKARPRRSRGGRGVLMHLMHLLQPLQGPRPGPGAQQAAAGGRQRGSARWPAPRQSAPAWLPGLPPLLWRGGTRSAPRSDEG